MMPTKLFIFTDFYLWIVCIQVGCRPLFTFLPALQVRRILLNFPFGAKNVFEFDVLVSRWRYRPNSIRFINNNRKNTFVSYTLHFGSDHPWMHIFLSKVRPDHSNSLELVLWSTPSISRVLLVLVLRFSYNLVELLSCKKFFTVVRCSYSKT